MATRQLMQTIGTSNQVGFFVLSTLFEAEMVSFVSSHDPFTPALTFINATRSIESVLWPRLLILCGIFRCILSVSSHVTLGLPTASSLMSRWVCHSRVRFEARAPRQFNECENFRSSVYFRGQLTEESMRIKVAQDGGGYGYQNITVRLLCLSFEIALILIILPRNVSILCCIHWFTSQWIVPPKAASEHRSLPCRLQDMQTMLVHQSRGQRSP